jgi:hypothetical protein
MKTTNILLAGIFVLQAALLVEMFTLRPRPTEWEYQQFTFLGNRTEYDVKWFDYVLIERWNGQHAPYLTDSNRVYSAGSLLDLIGYQGWELAWTDGKNYIVKRHGQGRDNFIVGTAPERE